MRKSKFSEHQIIGALKRAEQGVAVKDICRELGVSVATFYQWRSKYGGMEASDLKRINHRRIRLGLMIASTTSVPSASRHLHQATRMTDGQCPKTNQILGRPTPVRRP